ncbi:MAG: PEP-CTERM sorting domain-containing protein, partial [Bythopirellula sp.]
VVNNLPGEGQGDGVGVFEWEGWSFADRDWWANTAGDQQRAQFTNAVGTVAVADPDEWDDLGNPSSGGTYNTFLSTGLISLAGVSPDTLRLRFDSSWRDEDDQRVNITVAYDAGPPTEILRWTSTAGSDFHDDAPNESIDIALDNPQGASNAVITWGMEDAANDWWWAIDNISVEAPALTTLRVDPVSGAMELRGNLDQANITGYEITSTSGSLDVAGWQAGNLAAQDVDAIGSGPGESWEPLFFTPSQLAETFLLGSSHFDDTRVESLGIGFMPGGTQDLAFEFSETDGSTFAGVVEYATIYQDADFNEDGTVDETDLMTWENGYSQFAGNASKSDGDADRDGWVTGSDLLRWQTQFDGGTGNLIATIPEPTTWAMALMGLALIGPVVKLGRRN